MKDKRPSRRTGDRAIASVCEMSIAGVIWAFRSNQWLDNMGYVAFADDMPLSKNP
jgi:hypothetical protein